MRGQGVEGGSDAGEMRLRAQHLKRVLEVKPGEPPKVEGVILYEDFTCGLRVKHAFDGLFGEVFGRAGWAAQYRLSLWSFEMLRVWTIGARAAKESADADVFCIAVTSRRPLMPEVVFLFRHWMARKGDRACATVLAGYAEDTATLRSSPVGAYLRMAAKRTGKLFLVYPLGPAPFGSLTEVEDGRSGNGCEPLLTVAAQDVIAESGAYAGARA